jgi:hypothetical protein
MGKRDQEGVDAMERTKFGRRAAGFAGLWAGLIVLLAAAWPATGCGTLWPTGLSAASGAGGGPAGPGETDADRAEAARLSALEARCVRLDEGRLIWKGVAVGAGAMAAASSAATALTAGFADPEDAQWASLGLGLGSLVFGGVALLGTTMESAVAEDFARICGELWMPAERATEPAAIADDGSGPRLILGGDGVVEVVEPAVEPAPAAEGGDVAPPEGTGTGADGLEPEELAPAGASP